MPERLAQSNLAVRQVDKTSPPVEDGVLWYSGQIEKDEVEGRKQGKVLHVIEDLLVLAYARYARVMTATADQKRWGQIRIEEVGQDAGEDEEDEDVEEEGKDVHQGGSIKGELIDVRGLRGVERRSGRSEIGE